MQHILATYASREAAEAAVRTLESRGFSIQNVVIADVQHRVWRKLHVEHRPTQAEFVVYTLDELARSEWARGLLEADRSVPGSA